MPIHQQSTASSSVSAERDGLRRRWLFNRLADTYGEDQIFKDVDSIDLGDDFVDVITRRLLQRMFCSP